MKVFTIDLKIDFKKKDMKRIKKFGCLTIEQKLNVLQNELNEDEIILFQYYEINTKENGTQEEIDEFFEDYCDDIIYYYNPHVKVKIENEIVDELIKEIGKEIGREEIKQLFCK